MMVESLLHLFLPIVCLSLQAVSGCSVDYECDHNVTSLRELYSGAFPPESNVCANLTGKETVGYSETRLMFNAVIRGNNNIISCNESLDLGVNFTHFPLWFYNVSQVVLESLNFKGCQRPLHFEEVKTVVISDTDLRY
jgi:hypothetical protein